MKLIIRKAAYFLFTAILLFGSFFIVPGTNNLYAMADTDGLIEIQMDTFKKGTYSGAKVASHVDKEKCADLEIIASGGNHTDGEGNLVFSNYVLFNVCINYDANSKTISGTEIKAYNDRTDWDDMDKANGGKYGGSAEIKTEKQITYGAISAVRRNYLGEVEQYYTPVFCTSLNASSFEQQMFNIDGDYTIYVLFATQKGNVVQRHVLSWSFKVRTYIYLIDKTTGLQIKNSGVSGGDVIIDSANRQGVTVDITGAQQWLLTEVDLNNKPELTKSGTYKFIVRNRGFLCEVFYFTIDKESVDKKVYFDNLRRFVGKREVEDYSVQIADREVEVNYQYTYEAEGYFSFVWEDTETNPVLAAQYKFFDYSGNDTEAIKYVQGTVLDKVGTYEICVLFKTQAVVYYVNVVDMDNPSTNYEKLSTARFNTFKTKWWQVTDTVNNRVLCFDYDTEYNRAYEAAMTIANMSVIEGTGRYYFNGQWYNDRIDLTAAMNTYVFSDIKVVYYDPSDYSDDDSSLRTFSAAAFESVIYLNDEFQFISEHPSEVNEVTAISADGTEYSIEFSVPISEQSVDIPDGQYTIIETDKYGNQTTYTAYRDKSAPIVTISSEDEDIILKNGERYSLKLFSVASMYDLFDEYAVLKIQDPIGAVSYFYRDEYSGIVYNEEGSYKVTAYDRNGNTIVATIEL